MHVLDSNVTSGDLVRAVGGKRVRYGFATSSTDREGRSRDNVDHNGLWALSPQIRESSSGEFARDVVEQWAQDGFVPPTSDENTSRAYEIDRIGAMEMSTLSHQSLAPSQTRFDDEIGSQSVVLEKSHSRKRHRCVYGGDGPCYLATALAFRLERPAQISRGKGAKEETEIP